ncbi:MULTISPECIES: hypothetical protein [unclassified Mycobacterium]|uniref:hypothetical protein n=1 Tax=unclassified Mycobacterium TaxID=2642494 RepID=UPI0018D37C32|nr:MULTISPECIES: hypothetical protein [unclassified Mycobacterium]
MPNAVQRRRHHAFDAAAMVIARRRRRIQLAIVEIGEASCGFSHLWRWRSVVLNAAKSSTSSRGVAHLSGPERRSEKHGRLHVPSLAIHLLSEDQPMWDEWSSPGELIHPGDSASVSSTRG